MLSNRLILLRRSHVTSRLLDLHVRYNFKWDNYKNSIDIIESFGKLSKPTRMSQPENIGAPTRRVNKHIVESIKTRVFDPSSSSASSQSNNKRLKATASQQDSTGSSIGEKKNASASPQMGIRILSNGYGTGVKSFVLVTTTGNYLVNAGEGTLRFLKNEILKIRKIDHILMTRANWQCTGGLSSLTLELACFNQPLHIHSPVDWNLQRNHRLNRMFIDLACQKVSQHVEATRGAFDDNNLKIKLLNFNKDMSSLPVDQKASSYEITLKKQAPNFLVERMAELGVKQGPWIQQVIKGNTVTLEDGRVIKPEQVLDYSRCVEKKLIVLDLPDESYIDLLDTVVDKTDSSIQAIAHLSESKLLHNPKYTSWIASFPTNCVHMMFDEEYPSVDSEPPYKLQAQLHLVNRSIFPLLYAQTQSYRLLKEKCEKELRAMQREMKVVQAEPNMNLKLRPDLFLDLSKMMELDNGKFMNEIFEQYDTNLKLRADGGPDEATRQKLDTLKMQIVDLNEQLKNEMKHSFDSDTSYPKTLFLGTSSSNATSFRNVTSIMLQLNESSNMLLDCGEGSSGQLFKLFGLEQARRELVKIKLLFLTHIHLDHHGGVFGLILDRHNAFKALGIPYEKLKIMIPKYYVEQCIYCIENLMQKNIFDYVTLLPNELFIDKPNEYRSTNKKLNITSKYLAGEFTQAEQNQILSDIKDSLSLKRIETIAVHHIGNSYAILLEVDAQNNNNKQPFKLIFSGDCRPNDCLVTKGKDCDLLIHECTFDNKRQKDAIKKNHSTIQEAVSIAQRMNAKQTVLTHFSSRYGVLGHIDEINADRIGFSFDFLCLSPNNMDQINHIGDMLKTLFVSQLETNGERQTQYVLRNRIEQKTLN